MINITKYFVLLENLRFEHVLQNKEKREKGIQASVVSPSFERNMEILKQFVQTDISQQLEDLCRAMELGPDYAGTIDIAKPISCYIIRMLHVLHTLKSNINFDSDAREDLISVAHLKLCIQATQELSYYALRSQLHEDFYKSAVFKEAHCTGNWRCESSLVLLSVEFFRELLCIRQLHIANAMELVQRDLLAAVLSLRVLPQLATTQQAQLQATLNYLWTHESKADYFHHVLLLKATPQLSAPLAKELHHQLLSKLSSEQGFVSLLAALPASDCTRRSEIMANIVAQPGYTARLQQRLILQIFDYCRLVEKSSAGVLSLRRLYELNPSNRQSIETILESHWQPLLAPQDLLTGLIIWDQSELIANIRLWQQLFCSSSVACLPSQLLICYLPLLLQLYEQLPQALALERQAVAELIVRCLDNRKSAQELPALLQRLFSWQLKGTPTWQALHDRIWIGNAGETNLINVKVAEQQERQWQQCRLLPQLLIQSSNHPLSCKVFLALLQLMLQELKQPAASQLNSIDFVSSETELSDFLHGKYQLKLELLLALEQLVWHEPLKVQLTESQQSKTFLQLVAQLLKYRLSLREEAQEADQMLLLIIMLLQELLERSEQLQLAEITHSLQQPLEELAAQTSNVLIRNALQPLLSIFQGDSNLKNNSVSPFQRARELIEERQPHLQVYGIQIMLDAVRRKDPLFTSQSHRIIALALSTLKNKESYTFLNCVRLFVALVHIMESEVLDMLSDEYLSETADMDYRLVVGEAILKAANEIGPLCYRYKDVLLNCFLHGARSPLDEFRTSSYANLAQLCRLLGYQVHNFFQELLQLIDSELSTGRYLPAKRGALLVLAELLAGMESLLDYQEMLLPIYRLLRTIEAAESCDPQMRQHAANGLKVINAKCRELLTIEPMEQLQKEIKVLGINKSTTTNKKRHILELN